MFKMNSIRFDCLLHIGYSFLKNEFYPIPEAPAQTRCIIWSNYLLKLPCNNSQKIKLRCSCYISQSHQQETQFSGDLIWIEKPNAKIDKITTIEWWEYFLINKNFELKNKAMSVSQWVFGVSARRSTRQREFSWCEINRKCWFSFCLAISPAWLPLILLK